MSDAAMQEQIRYYAARAGEYDDWWFRRGRYDRGAEANARWFAEAGEVRAALDADPPRGEVLELACGTGLWTAVLARHADRVTALDAVDEVLGHARSRLRGAGVEDRVELRRADLFSWRPERRFREVFFAFWLSHVPERRFDAFWTTVGAALAPGGRVRLVDSRRTERSTAADHVLPGAREETMVRRLDDGREFRIVKRFLDVEPLTERLEARGWAADLRETDEFFLHGTVRRAA